MQFQPMYDDGQLFLPKIELDMTSNQTIGIITDLKRKQFLMNQLADRSQYYIFRAGQNEYMRLTVEELIAFLIHVTERSERVDSLLDYCISSSKSTQKNRAFLPIIVRGNFLSAPS